MLAHPTVIHGITQINTGFVPIGTSNQQEIDPTIIPTAFIKRSSIYPYFFITKADGYALVSNWHWLHIIFYKYEAGVASEIVAVVISFIYDMIWSLLLG